jgi:hypothetical protein
MGFKVTKKLKMGDPEKCLELPEMAIKLSRKCRGKYFPGVGSAL